MDAVRTAKRLGAKKVSIVYRRRVADMTALPGEIEGAVAEGIELQTLKAPASIDVDENHHVKGIYVTPQMVSSIRDGRASIKSTGEEDIYIPCDVLIVAIGQNIETHHFEQAGIPVERGKIITKSTGAFENLPGVFAGGTVQADRLRLSKQSRPQRLLQPTLMSILDIIMKFPAMLKSRRRIWMTVHLAEE